MSTKTYEVYGCVEDSEIFLGASGMLQIAIVTANNNLGTARYTKVVIYEAVQENNGPVKREPIQILSA